MKLRAALAAVVVVPSAVALTGPAGPAHAVAVCQGQPATIEGSAGTVTGTEGNDVIVSTGTDAGVRALGGNDLICVEGGDVHTGLGDDSVLSTAPAGVFTSAVLVGGTDSYVSGLGTSDVIVDEVSSLHVVMAGPGTVLIYPTSTPGTGTIEFGTASSHLYAFGEKRARVDLAAQTASVDGLLAVTTSGLRHATATGCKVRMKGNGKNNTLDAFGHDIVVSGGGGRDTAAPGRQRLRPGPARVRALQVAVPRPGRPRPPLRQARRRRADRRVRPRCRQRRGRHRHLPHGGPQELRALTGRSPSHRAAGSLARGGASCLR